MTSSLPPAIGDTENPLIDIQEEGQINNSQHSPESPDVLALRQDILDHFRSLKLPALNGGGTGELSKDAIRAS